MNKDLLEYGQYKHDIFNKLNFNFKSGLKILDIGCGDGSDSLILSKEYGLKTYSIDLYKHPDINKIKGIEFVIGSVYDVPFPEQYFDYVFMHDVLHHIDEENQSEIQHLCALDKVAKVTKDNGQIIIIEGNRYNPIFYPHMVKSLGHNHWKQSYFIQVINKSFQDVEFKYFESHLYPWGYKFWKIYELCMEKIISKKFSAYNVAIITKNNKTPNIVKKTNVNNSLYSFLCCAKCGSDLNKFPDRFECVSCFFEYPILGGVGVFVDLNNLPNKLKKQVTYFEKEDITNSPDYIILPWQQFYIDRFMTYIKDFDNKTIIDCGTGSGYMAIELALRGANVIALDLTLRNCIRLLKIAQKKNVQHKVIAICSSAEKIPIKSHLIDTYVSNSVLEHLPSEKKAISEINRICQPKANLMIAVPILYRYLNPILLPLNLFHDRLIGHLRRYDETVLKKKFSTWEHQSTLYTGHTNKVLYVVFNIILKKLKIRTINEKYIEDQDKLKESFKWFSSNIIVFFKRK